MVEGDLTWEERECLYKVSAVVFLIVFFTVMAYFIYLMNTDPFRSAWEVYVQIVLLFAFSGPTAFFLAFEFLYHRRIKKAARFHVRRFVGNVFVPLVGTLTLLGLQCVFVIVFSKTLSEFRAILLATALWVVVFFIIVLKLRDRQIQTIF